MTIGDVNDIFPISKTLLFKRRTLNDILAPIFVFFFLRKIHPASLSIMLGHEHNVEHNAMILGVTLKGIILKFSSIIYLFNCLVILVGLHVGAITPYTT